MSEEAIHHVGEIIAGLEPGSFVTKFVVVAEVIDPEGVRGLWIQASDDAKRWDTYGMLMDALEEERAAHHRDAAPDYGD